MGNYFSPVILCFKIYTYKYSTFVKGVIFFFSFFDGFYHKKLLSKKFLSILLYHETETPQVGLEPTTNRLTADRSTTELLRQRTFLSSLREYKINKYL